LQAAVLLVNTGQLGTYAPPSSQGLEWLQNPQDSNSPYYQAHDIGNILLMAPSAALGSVLSKSPLEEKIESPPLLARVAVAMTCSIISAVGCFFMFKLFSLFYSLRTAFLLSLAFATTTFFWAYSKSAWDVLGACMGTSILLYCAAKILHEEQLRNRTILFAGGALVLAGSFRYSLAPFLVLNVLAVFYFARSKVRWQHLTLLLLVVLVGFLPSFIYNFVRTGSFLIPALAAEQFNPNEVATGPDQWQQTLTGNTLEGLLGLTLAPNKGLFVFAPILLLLFFVPFAWKTFPAAARRLILSFGIGTVLYVLLISSLSSWGAFGWGPRYLLPILPILFFAVGLTLASLWDKHKYPLIGLIIVSFVLNAAPALVNWHTAINEFPQATDEYAPLPYQHIAVWHGVYLATQGEPLPTPPDIANDPIRSAGSRFPDLWTFRLMELSTPALLAGLLISLALLATLLWCFRKLVINSESSIRLRR